MERQPAWGNKRQRISEALRAIVCVCFCAPVMFPCWVDQLFHRLSDPHRVKSEQIAAATAAATIRRHGDHTLCILSERAVCLK